MRIVDPQSALLTNAEVYNFLKNQSPRQHDKKIGAYEPVDLKGYKEVRQDVLRYGQITTPQLASSFPPEQYMAAVVKRLRKYDLTKTEVYTIINLALGLPRPQPATSNGIEEESQNGENDKATSDSADVGSQIPPADVKTTEEVRQNDADIDNMSGNEVLGLIIDSLDERFPEETREEKMTEILAVLRGCIASSTPSAAHLNNDA